MYGLGTILLALSALQLGKSSGKNDRVIVKHSIPGRLRIASERLKNENVASVLVEQLSKVSGIESISANEITGSLLVVYNPEIVEEEILVMSLVSLIEGKKEIRKESSTLFQEVRLVKDSINHGLMEKTGGKVDLKGLIPTVLIFAAIKKIIATKTLGSPSALTLLYWAYNQINKHEENIK